MTDDNETSQSSSKKAKQDYTYKLEFIHDLNKAAKAGLAERLYDQNVALGQNVLREEIGYFGEYEGQRYRFDEGTKNILLAHARQDVAAVHGMSGYILRRVVLSEKRTELCLKLLIAVLVVQFVVLVRLW